MNTYTLADYEDNLIVMAKLRADALGFFLDDEMEKYELMMQLAEARQAKSDEIRCLIMKEVVK